MFCPYCGTKIEDDSRFCPACGKNVTGELVATKSEPVVVRPKASGNVPESSTRRKNTSISSPKNKKNNGGVIRKVIFAVLALAVIGFVAYKYINEQDGSDQVTKSSRKPYFHLADEAENTSIDNAESVAPSDLSLISYFPTREEIEAVEPILVEVSAEHPICQIGDITVEFPSFEFDEFALPDTLQLRRLGTRHDDTSGRDLTIFDFSLKSGKHQFSSDVYVSLPRPANGNGVLYYNESTRAWELAPYSISDDLKTYTWRTNHFSDISISEDRSIPSLTAIPSDMHVPSTGIASGTIDPMTDQEKSDYVSDCFYYVAKKNLDKKKILTQSIGIDLDRFKVAMLPSYIRAPLLSEYLSSEDKDEIENSLAQGELYASMKLLKDGNDYMSKYNSWQTIFKVLLAKGPSFPESITGPLGELHLRYRLINSVEKQDAEAIMEVIKDFFKNNLTSIRDEAAGSNPILLLLCACWDLFGEDIVKEFSAIVEFYPVTDFEYIYHKYMTDGIDMGKYGTLKLNGSGWENAINVVIDGILANGGSVAAVTPQIDALFRDFLDRFFTIDEDERLRFAVNYTKEYDKWYNARTAELKRLARLGEPVIFPSYSPKVYDGLPVPDSIRVYKQRAYEKLHYYAEKEISKAIKEMPEKICDNLYMRYIKDVLPVLNTKMIFVVKDKHLLNGSTFDKSPYNINGKIKFNGTEPFKQVPIGTMFSDFEGDVLNPYAEVEGSNVIFTCTRYYYLQMGCPTKITFEGTDDLKPIPIEFTVPKTISGQPVYIYLDNAEGEEAKPEEEVKKNDDSALSSVSQQGQSKPAEKEKAWVRVSTKVEIPKEKVEEASYSASELTHTVNYNLYLPDYKEWHKAKAVTTCNVAPPDVIHAGDSVVFHVVVDSYDVQAAYTWGVSGDIHFDKADVGNGGISRGARRAKKRNEKGNGMYFNTFDGNKHGECDYVLYFDKGKEGEPWAINFCGNGCRTHWVYEWK